jgi:hypothetical protein
MNIEQLIDALSNTAAVIGPHAEVKAWHLGKAAGTQPLDTFQTSGVSAGWDKGTQLPLAVIKIAV